MADSVNYSISWPPNGTHAIEEARVEIDRIIQELKERRNSLSPLLQLPVELVQRIVFFMGEGMQPVPGSYPVPASRPWLQVTHVCRALRAAALADHSLWNVIGCHEGRWVDEFARRSSDLPLSLTLIATDAPTIRLQKHGLKALSNHIHHASQVHIEDVIPRLCNQIVTPIISKSAPRLRNFVLFSGTEMNIPSLYQLPHPLFADGAPNLSNISLAGVVVFDNTFRPDLHSLTEISLYRIIFRSSDVSDRPALLSVLAGLPLLRKLVVRWCDLATDFGTSSHTPPLLMEDLEFLEIADEIPSRVNLLLGSIFPPRTTLKIELVETADDVLSQEELLERAWKFWDSVKSRTGTQNGLSVALYDEEHGDESNGPHSIMLTRHPDPDNCYLELLVQHLHDEDTQAIIGCLTGRFQIEEVEAYDERDVALLDRHGLFRTCSRIVLDLWDPFALSRLLKSDIPGTNLKHLIVRDDDSMQSFEELTRWLRSRHKQNRGLERIEIEVEGEANPVAKAHIEEWRTFVPNVHLGPPHRKTYGLSRSNFS
jgi:hypothetical protein